MYACGLRINEVRPLEVSSIDGQKQLLRIIGKGNKERLIPLPTSTLYGLRSLWREHRHPRFLFPNKGGTNAVHSCVLYRTFKDALREAGLPSEITPHVLRHSYATRLMENDVDLRTTQILMGHSSIKSTLIYSHLTEPTRKKLRSTLDTIMADL
ncbi:phage integrase family protein [Magnetococcus marinus MC-1]|uniref:Phage integrase family protein n=2 Tax=Magnetococcus TaxID=162171 RepID=A0LBL1_MAGMM|nr:phage integrase family protein [Magnetococcus marinus MC-1]